MYFKINIFIFIILSKVLFSVSGPTPPIIPEIEVINNHEKITLIWNDDSENSIDSATNYADFEGYRLYRSTDGGITWGEDDNGGDSDLVSEFLQGSIINIFSNILGFVALKTDGSLVAWGNQSGNQNLLGGAGNDDYSQLPEDLPRIADVYSNGSAFAAIKSE